MKPRFVDGLLFAPDLNHVVLIRKNRPDWQAGKLNCVGGKIEEGETPYAAMVREFKEETGAHIPDWRSFLDMRLTRGDGELYCFYARGGLADLGHIVSQTDEKVDVYRVADVMERYDALPNLRWMIQMALSFEMGEPSAKFTLQEVAVGQY